MRIVLYDIKVKGIHLFIRRNGMEFDWPFTEFWRSQKNTVVCDLKSKGGGGGGELANLACLQKVVTIDPDCSLRSDLDTTSGRKLQLIIGPPEHVDLRRVVLCLVEPGLFIDDGETPEQRSSVSDKTNCDPFCPGCVPTAHQINRDMDHVVAFGRIKLSLLTFLAQR
uniref:Uncharacterized protein n=1 Tax=Branchiostoma floridae TaxID=7739 RepID=C3YNY2_BRAFL|eukprot:XP_002602080.1 hypothetical protein BRAFLDRAFT_94419 [Branchiostoma floridae]